MDPSSVTKSGTKMTHAVKELMVIDVPETISVQITCDIRRLKAQTPEERWRSLESEIRHAEIDLLRALKLQGVPATPSKGRMG